MEKNTFVNHLWTLFQQWFIPLREWELVGKNSAPDVRMGRGRPCVIRVQRKGRTLVLGEERHLTNEKGASACESRWLNWSEELKEWYTQ